MAVEVGLVASAVSLPTTQQPLAELCALEGVPFADALAEAMHTQAVPTCTDETGSTLALAAAQEALARAEVQGSDLGVLVDYSVLPQEYLVPAWNMSNMLQDALGAKRAYTLGFSGGGATNFLVALDAATALLRTDETVHTILLVGADVALPGNRVLPPEAPLAILGDAASAVVLQRGAHRQHVLSTALWSDGAMHDVCYIPGGALAHPDRPDLYRMVLDRPRYEQAPRTATLKRLLAQALDDAQLASADIEGYLLPNLSAADRNTLVDGLGLAPEKVVQPARPPGGHLQGTDFVVGLQAAHAQLSPGAAVALLSHGMGYLYGVTLIRL